MLLAVFILGFLLWQLKYSCMTRLLAKTMSHMLIFDNEDIYSNHGVILVPIPSKSYIDCLRLNLREFLIVLCAIL